MGLPDHVNSERYDFARDFVQAQAAAASGPLTVFDIGAGQLPMKKYIEDTGSVWHGFDLFPSDPSIKRWNLEEVCPIDEKADAVILLDVLEHLYNPGLAMANIAAAMKPGAYLFLTMPNPKWSRGRFHALTRGYLPAFYPRDLDVNHHVFTTWPHVVNRLIADTGFEVLQRCNFDEADPKPAFSPSGMAAALVKAACRAIESKDPETVGLSYGITVRKTREPGGGITGTLPVGSVAH